jgi:predicted transposase YbfD/YdcC
MGCQKAMAHQIVAQGGDYVLALKGNQESLHEAVRLFFDHALKTGWEAIPHHTQAQTAFGQGRKETRRVWQVDLADLDGRWAEVQQEWRGLASLVRLESERVRNQQTRTEVRYYLSSLFGNAARVLRSIRLHWGVENSVH